MPIYEFSCSTCDRSFEELVRSAEATNEVVCPSAAAGTSSADFAVRIEDEHSRRVRRRAERVVLDRQHLRHATLIAAVRRINRIPFQGTRKTPGLAEAA